MKGTVKWFDIKKGYGFIVSDDGKSFFVHYSDIKDDKDGFRKLSKEDKVEFNVLKREKGPQAVDVKLIQKGRRINRYQHKE